MNIVSNGIKRCHKYMVSLLPKMQNLNLTMRKQLRNPNWGISYKITCPFHQKCWVMKSRKDRGPVKDTWQLNTTSGSEQGPFAWKDITEATRETWPRDSMAVMHQCYFLILIIVTLENVLVHRKYTLKCSSVMKYHIGNTLKCFFFGGGRGYYL